MFAFNAIKMYKFTEGYGKQIQTNGSLRYYGLWIMYYESIGDTVWTEFDLKGETPQGVPFQKGGNPPLSAGSKVETPWAVYTSTNSVVHMVCTYSYPGTFFKLYIKVGGRHHSHSVDLIWLG